VQCHKRHAVQLKKKRPLHRAVRAAAWRAKRDGIEFSLREQDLIIPEVCLVFGTPMATPSLDRRNNDLGYTMDNVRVISWEANRLKHRLTLEQVEALAEYMRN
jgi:hypothetical protein